LDAAQRLAGLGVTHATHHGSDARQGLEWAVDRDLAALLRDVRIARPLFVALCRNLVRPCAWRHFVPELAVRARRERRHFSVVLVDDDRSNDGVVLFFLVDEADDVALGRSLLDELLDHLGLDDGRPIPGVDRPAPAKIDRPWRYRRQLLDTALRTAQPDVDRGEQ
jgi:hypothetical protein